MSPGIGISLEQMPREAGGRTGTEPVAVLYHSRAHDSSTDDEAHVNEERTGVFAGTRMHCPPFARII
jgi:hypothetical protein